MKTIKIKLLLATLVMLSASYCMANDPPHPNGGDSPGGEGQPLGGGAPLSGGTGLLILLSAGYTILRYRNKASDQRDEVNGINTD